MAKRELNSAITKAIAKATTMSIVLRTAFENDDPDVLAMEMVAADIMKNKAIVAFLGDLPPHDKHQALIEYISKRLLSQLKDRKVKPSEHKITDYFTKSELATVRSLVDQVVASRFLYRPTNKRLIRIVRRFPLSMYFQVVEFIVPLGFGVAITNGGFAAQIVYEAVYRLNGGTGKVVYPAAKV